MPGMSTQTAECGIAVLPPQANRIFSRVSNLDGRPVLHINSSWPEIQECLHSPHVWQVSNKQTLNTRDVLWTKSAQVTYSMSETPAKVVYKLLFTVTLDQNFLNAKD